MTGSALNRAILKDEFNMEKGRAALAMLPTPVPIRRKLMRLIQCNAPCVFAAPPRVAR